MPEPVIDHAYKHFMLSTKLQAYLDAVDGSTPDSDGLEALQRAEKREFSNATFYEISWGDKDDEKHEAALRVIQELVGSTHCVNHYMPTG